ncbi:YdaU family protein [Stenotrophomonas sp.]|uniref:YdaU family protein n=1 Tax=Stenotrophomonas sp. TaxID=69392 RepID=UPI002896C597|nr:YdaU family protein [Stenotrophomonas sp.]
MIYFELYPGDYLRDTSRLSLTEHGAYLRLMLAYYAEEAPLPEAFSELFVIAGATTSADKAAVKKVADRYFPVGDDGLRRNGRADEEIAKAQDRIADGKERRAAKKGTEAERQARTRARRTMFFEDLRAKGIVPDGMATMEELRALHVTHVTGSDAATNQALSRVTDGVTVGVTCHVTSRVTEGVTGGVNTGNQTPDPTITPDTSLHTQTSQGGVTEQGRACVLMRSAGCHTTNPSHPELLAAIAEGVTPEVLRDTVAEGLSRSPPIANPFPWAVKTARNRHAAGATPTNTTATGGHHGNPQLGSADHVAEQRRKHEQRAAAGGLGQPGRDVIDVEFEVVR